MRTKQCGEPEPKTYIGIDNGVTGSIGITCFEKDAFYHTPTKSELSYTKEAKHITRIDSVKLLELLKAHMSPNMLLVMERPMVDPKRWTATLSAIRALEATLIVIELLKIPYRYIDSKEWQKVMLPSGIKGSDELKKASKDIGGRLFPQFKDLYKSDADGILIAEFARRERL
jgi:hypothetical protein